MFFLLTHLNSEDLDKFGKIKLLIFYRKIVKIMKNCMYLIL